MSALAWIAVMAALSAAPSSPAEIERYNQAGVDILGGLKHLDPAVLGTWSLGSARDEGAVRVLPCAAHITAE